jgi:hypothetical protein
MLLPRIVHQHHIGRLAAAHEVMVEQMLIDVAWVDKTKTELISNSSRTKRTGGFFFTWSPFWIFDSDNACEGSADINRSVRNPSTKVGCYWTADDDCESLR